MKKVFVLKQTIALKDINSTQDDGVESINVIAVVGEWKGYDNGFGGFKITPGDLTKMVENFNALKRDVVVDFEHQTLTGKEAPAAGWIKKLEVVNDELHGHFTWTDKAKEYIKNGEYKYLSPVFSFNTLDHESGLDQGITLHSVALTNAPFLDELGEVKINKQDVKEENGEDSDEAMLDELVAAKVENAILKEKITPDQRAWALAYCKSDSKGFDDFLSTVKILKDPGANNMFVNKGQPKQQQESVDVVAIATKNIGE